MPDTGAPWNIPYVESTDLVSDWPADSLALANAIDAGLDAAGNAGIGSNAVQAVKTATQATSVATGGTTAVTSLTCTITPSSASSKILVMAVANVACTVASESSVNIILKRDGTAIGIGAASGSRTRVSSGPGYINTFGGRPIGNAVAIYVDSPATTSAVDYTIDMHNVSGSTNTLLLNRGDTDDSNAASGRAASSITAIEVAA